MMYGVLCKVYPYVWSAVLPVFEKCMKRGMMKGEVPIKEFVRDLYADRQVCV